jgi:hypothetical protein
VRVADDGNSITTISNTFYAYYAGSGTTPIITSTRDFIDYTSTTSSTSISALNQEFFFYDQNNQRFVLMGILGSDTSRFVYYTSSDYGVTWSSQSNVFTQSGTIDSLGYVMEYGTDHILIQYRVGSTSNFVIRYINKHTLATGVLYSGTQNNLGSIRYIKNIGVGGAGYGRFISVGNYSWYADESSSGIGSITRFTSYNSEEFDICYVNGKYVSLWNDSTGNNYLKLFYSLDLITWTACTQPVIYGATASTNFNDKTISYGHRLGGTILYQSNNIGTQTYGILTSTDGITWEEIDKPSNFSNNGVRGIVL